MNPRGMLLMLAVLWVGVLVSASAAIQMRHQSRSLFMQLERLTAERDRLSIEWGRLQLEQSSWSTLGVVEQEASSRLGMTIPVARAVRMVTP